MKALDPRSPLVVDTRELGRRPGASQRLSRTVPAPTDLGSEVVGVPAGAPVRLALLLESVMEGVLVSGTASGTTAGQCVRCLDDVEAAFEAPLQELYVYADRPMHGVGPGAVDDDERRTEGDLLDLEPALRDAIVPILPFQPVCREDCPGLPTRYGADDDDDPSALPDDVDPRWAALATLAGGTDSRTDSRTDRRAGPRPGPRPGPPTSTAQRTEES